MQKLITVTFMRILPIITLCAGAAGVTGCLIFFYEPEKPKGMTEESLKSLKKSILE